MRKKQKQDSMFLPLIRQSKYQWPKGMNLGLPGCIVDGNTTFGFDTETKGLDCFGKDVYILTVAVSPNENVSWSLRINFNGSTCSNFELVQLQELVERHDVTLIGHNIKFDLKWLAVKYKWEISCQVFDTMLAAYFLDENLPASLDDCMPRFLNRKSHKGMVNTADLESEHIDDVLLYNGLDAETEVRLMKAQIPLLEKEGCLPLMAVANQMIPILTKMEARGICIDVEYAKKQELKILERCVDLRIKLKQNNYGTFDPNSDKDLRHVIYNVIGCGPIKYTEKGTPSVDTETLNDLKEQCFADPDALAFLNNLIEYSEKMKELTTYYQPIKDSLKYDGRKHPRFNLGKNYDEKKEGEGTVTGRLSGDMQQIKRSKALKGMYVPTTSYSFIDGDFSQLELRVGAWLSQEPKMIEAFEAGLDIHSAVMSEITGMPYDEIEEGKDKSDAIKNERTGYKNVNFGIFYGMEAHRLHRQLKVTSGIDWNIDTCKNFINKWRATYPSAAIWIEEQKGFIARHGFARMSFGQKRRLPDAMLLRIRDNWKLIARAERQGVNFVVQSTASWICLIGMIILDQYYKDESHLDGHILLQVHDNVLSEVKQYTPLGLYEHWNELEIVSKDIQQIMEKETVYFIKHYFGLDFNVPLSFPTKVLDRWE